MQQRQKTQRLSDVRKEIWQALRDGASDLEHPFRTPILGTVTASGAAPSLRVVVLREWNPARRELVVHTDIRSRKVQEIGCRSTVQLCFYDPDRRVQVQASGRAKVETVTRAAKEAWAKTPRASQWLYATRQAPGSKVKHLRKGWKPWHGHMGGEMDQSQWLAKAERHFALLRVTVGRVEYLRLDWEGHVRACFAWRRGRFVGDWLVP